MKIKLIKFFYLNSYLRLIKIILAQLEKIIFGKIEEISIYNCKEVSIKKIYSSHNFEMPDLKDVDGKQLIKSYFLELAHFILRCQELKTKRLISC